MPAVGRNGLLDTEHLAVNAYSAFKGTIQLSDADSGRKGCLYYRRNCHQISLMGITYRPLSLAKDTS